MTSIMQRRLSGVEGQLAGLARRLGLLGQQICLTLRIILTVIWASTIAPLVMLLARSATWRRALDVLIDTTILGGMLGVPAMAVAACVGLCLPPQAALHQVGGQLFGIAILWFVLALLCAHLQAWWRGGEPVR